MTTIQTVQIAVEIVLASLIAWVIIITIKEI